MKTSFPIAFLMFLCISTSASANEYVGLRGQISAVRESVVLLLSRDNFSKNDFRKQLKDQTDAVSKRLTQIRPTGSKSAAFKELTTIWNDYSKTYEQDFVKALNSGDQAAARSLITTVQRDRLQRMQQLLTELSAT